MSPELIMLLLFAFFLLAWAVIAIDAAERTYLDDHGENE
jgi:hypothetical protein